MVTIGEPYEVEVNGIRATVRNTYEVGGAVASNEQRAVIAECEAALKDGIATYVMDKYRMAGVLGVILDSEILTEDGWKRLENSDARMTTMQTGADFLKMV